MTGNDQSNEPEFHGDWAEASQSVVDYAQEIIRKYHPMLEQAKIGFLFRIEAQITNGKRIIGKAQKVTPRLKPFMDFDFVIWVAQDEWERAPEARRRALIDHELCHCILGNNGWTIRPHDFEEFNEIIDRHGFWTHDLLHVQEAARQEQLPGFAGEGKVETVSVRQFNMLGEAGDD
jgi:Putative phage metallopeptidase